MTGQKRNVVKKPTPHIVKQRPPAVRLYRRIAFTFIVLTIALLGLVAYLSFVKADIKIYTDGTVVETDFNIDVVEEKPGVNQVEGRFDERTYEKSKELQPSGEGVTELAKAGGEVTVINNYSSDQPLVATTRLLAPDGKLYRIDETVNVPAGGRVTVMARADEEGPEYEIGPTTFTIPGLWAGLQDKIYAESSAPMTGGTITKSVVSESDLERAENDLAAEIFNTAKEEMTRANVDPRFAEGVFTYEIAEKISDTRPGEETDNFNIKIVMKVIGAFYNPAQMNNVMIAKIEEAAGPGYVVGEVDKENSTVAIKSYDADAKVANFDAHAVASALIKESSDSLKKERLTGLKVREAEIYLMGLPEVNGVEIDMHPFWVKRLPKLEDHIEFIIVNEPLANN